MSLHRASVRISAVLVLALGAAALGCSSKSDGGPTAPPPPTWTSLIGRSWTVAPGADGTFNCSQIQLPADLYIKGFRTATAAGDFRLYLTVSNALFTPGVGDFPCSAGVHGDRALYVAGIGTPDFTFPAGVGEHLKAGQYLILTLQQFNSSSASESGSTEVSIVAGTAADVTQNADILVAGASQFTGRTMTDRSASPHPWCV
jgi:hypothetical protein